ncbi:MAG: hypothetical protein ACLFPL_01915 [Candidatus Nanoarchaeia archaeon]
MEISKQELFQRISSIESEFQEIKDFFNEKESNLTNWAKKELSNSRNEEESYSLDDI